MKKIKLDELQLAIMQVLWDKGEATVAEIQEALKGSRDLAITTIGTVLSRLEDKKKAVTHVTQGRKYVYQAVISEQETKSSMVHSLVKQLFKGRSASLVNHLLQEDELDKNELEQLKEMIKNAEKKQGE
ncbi:BlaI/MecI/CopY family transcriptional regulator [Microscilla marina]|uniref:BlaI family transcriptional regulator n=1 Tax=Microscilla marina ATCC 23134 TaxID=313606 RepID=A1ZSY8_MICM2|nr:BlaI/MecI/CopY family transcriptional regulator [Microscilla marina]EAY26552.1 BlaI family transcriptional regulator [Microscilla marina ATCC 23134]